MAAIYVKTGIEIDNRIGLISKACTRTIQMISLEMTARAPAQRLVLSVSLRTSAEPVSEGFIQNLTAEARKDTRNYKGGEPNASVPEALGLYGRAGHSVRHDFSASSGP
jgi:hypothetical protein